MSQTQCIALSITDELGYNEAVFDKLIQIKDSKTFHRLIDSRNIGLYIFGFIIIAVTWSGVKTIQTNYELQKKVSRLQQENDLQKLENENIALRNQFLQTDEYLELSARRQFNRSSPGETLVIVPKEVAMRNAPNIQTQDAPVTQVVSAKDESVPTYVQNLRAWRDFLLGRGISSSVDKNTQNN